METKGSLTLDIEEKMEVSVTLRRFVLPGTQPDRLRNEVRNVVIVIVTVQFTGKVT